MSANPQQTVLAEFTDVLHAYTCRQQELLALLRRLHTTYPEVAPGPPGSTPPGRGTSPSAFRAPPAPAGHRVRSLQHPSPRPGSPPHLTLVTAPHSGSGPGDAPPGGGERRARGWDVQLLGAPVHPTRRDYDYFADLDRRLGRLGGSATDHT